MEMEDPMNDDLSSLSSVGFRHVIEDGLAILRGVEVHEDRRQFVLADLERIAADAKSASTFPNPQALLFGGANREAHQVFSLLNKRFAKNGADWQQWLQSAALAFDKMAHQPTTVTDDDRPSPVRFLED